MLKKIFFIYSILLTLIIIIFIISIFLIDKNFLNSKDGLLERYPNLRSEFRRKLFNSEPLINNLNNDYNVKFLPETQFTELKLKRKKIIFNNFFYNNHTKNGYLYFFIEQFEDKIIISDYLGGIYFIKQIELKSETNSIKPQNIKTNLTSVVQVLDNLIHKNKLYLSYIEKNDNCETFNITVSEINNNFLNFKKIFKSKDCVEVKQGGRMTIYRHNGIEGLLVSASDQTSDKIDMRPQNDNSIFGKILFINLENNNFQIFSKGHRNIQGLYSLENLIISTEHGPRGGDEINKIIFNKNYGWPISSYGEKYSLKDEKKSFYKKNHKPFKFVEPIYAFVPSIGISEIISLPNSFSKIFKNNFILSSLFGRSLYRIKFDDTYSRVIFKEKIFIGERVRDIKYSNKLLSLLLAFEENGEIGIISNLAN
ncbi:MAG: hypothetical protein CBE47_01220 [Pelagibacteraceae bacterium TMED287]|nr:MAG: hypothetical protein CBE47_01220 [Pelagibacteraceae bacterium TMED287]|tara:strand:+ start:2 stop:1273 length:1272 start_codon:yes stop_codon:yes gene_type:complete